MTVESNDAIAIASLNDWLKKSRASFSTNENQNQHQWNFLRATFFFHALTKLQLLAMNPDWFIALFGLVLITWGVVALSPQLRGSCKKRLTNKLEIGCFIKHNP